MSRGFDTWYSLPDLERLAQFERTLEGELSLGRLKRLAELLVGTDGTVNSSLSFHTRKDGRVELRLHCAADVEVVCQRCLEPMKCTLASTVEYLLVDADPVRGGTPADDGDVALLALAGRRLNPKDLIEDELIVSLPFAPRHENERDCGTLARKLDELSSDGGSDDEVGTVNN
jgi:uncharacterized protein